MRFHKCKGLPDTRVFFHSLSKAVSAAVKQDYMGEKGLCQNEVLK